MYGVRLLWWWYNTNFRGPLGLGVICIYGVPLILLFLLCGSIILTLITYSIWQTGSLIPAIVLGLCLYVGFVIPLPPNPSTPEERHFLKYRSDYEAVVELAKNGQLQKERPNEPGLCYQLPDNLQHVSEAGCLSVSSHRDRGLTVTFNPLAPFYHPVVYVENDDVRYPCPDGNVEQHIDDHWYVCMTEWN